MQTAYKENRIAVRFEVQTQQPRTLILGTLLLVFRLREQRLLGFKAVADISNTAKRFRELKRPPTPKITHRQDLMKPERKRQQQKQQAGSFQKPP